MPSPNPDPTPLAYLASQPTITPAQPIRENQEFDIAITLTAPAGNQTGINDINFDTFETRIIYTWYYRDSNSSEWRTAPVLQQIKDTYDLEKDEQLKPNHTPESVKNRRREVLFSSLNRTATLATNGRYVKCEISIAHRGKDNKYVPDINQSQPSIFFLNNLRQQYNDGLITVLDLVKLIGLNTFFQNITSLSAQISVIPRIPLFDTSTFSSIPTPYREYAIAAADILDSHIKLPDEVINFLINNDSNFNGIKLSSLEAASTNFDRGFGASADDLVTYEVVPGPTEIGVRVFKVAASFNMAYNTQAGIAYNRFLSFWNSYSDYQKTMFFVKILIQGLGWGEFTDVRYGCELLTENEMKQSSGGCGIDKLSGNIFSYITNKDKYPKTFITYRALTGKNYDKIPLGIVRYGIGDTYNLELYEKTWLDYGILTCLKGQEINLSVVNDVMASLWVVPSPVITDLTLARLFDIGYIPSDRTDTLAYGQLAVSNISQINQGVLNNIDTKTNPPILKNILNTEQNNIDFHQCRRWT